MNKRVRFFTDDWQRSDGEVIERNGNLVLVRDRDTGEECYRTHQEVDQCKW